MSRPLASSTDGVIRGADGPTTVWRVSRLGALLPALATVAAFAFLSGIPSCRDIRSLEARTEEVGSEEDHELEAVALRRRVEAARAELDALRAAPAESSSQPGVRGQGPRPFPSAALPAAAFGEAHRRILGHGARILHVAPGPRAGESGTGVGAEAVRLLRLRNGREPRSWNVSIEAPWAAVQAILDDFAAGSGDADAPLVQSLTMQPAVGDGKPACWLLTILQ